MTVISLSPATTGQHKKEAEVPIEGRPAFTKKAKINQALVQSTHRCLRNGSRIYCTKCNMSVSADAKHLFNLLEPPCIPQLKHVSFPVANRSTHPTHNLICYGGVYFCLACGATAVNKLVKLFTPCMPLRHGLFNFNLRAYRAGKAPQGFPGWPCKHLHDAHTSIASGIQKKIDSPAESYGEQQADLSSNSDEEVINSDLSSYHSSRSSHVGSNSGSVYLAGDLSLSLALSEQE